MVVCRKSLALSVILFASQINAANLKTHLEENNDSNPVVETNVGTIRGLRAEDGDYSMFMGIPFAEVDRSNVFGPAKPYLKFENIFDAFDDSAICPQERDNEMVGTLDCLHLNIYVPNNASVEIKLPVLVYIYGGAWSIGSADRFRYGPSFLVRHDIILVLFNYRVGPYGFMCLDSPEVPGNQGLKDQVLALKWINENIGAFGGDNTKVTISGNSAGGMSVEFHLYYGQDENLFQKIIPQSGSVLMPDVVVNSDYAAPFKLAEYFNHITDDLKKALLFLGSVHTHDIIAASIELGLSFGPCIEKEFENTNTYVTKHPVNADVPRVKDVEILIGFTNDEVSPSLMDVPDYLFSSVDIVGLLVNVSFDFQGEGKLYTEMKEVLTHFYFGDRDITVDLKREVSNMISDFTFNHAALRSVRKYLDNGVKTLYLYLFSYTGGRNFQTYGRNTTGTGDGAAHADELGYLFDISYMEKPLDPEDELIVDRMTEMWANFVKYGNPVPETTNLIPVQWLPVTKEKWNYLEINSDLRTSTRPFHKRSAFLDLFYMKNEQFQLFWEQRQEPESNPDPTPEPESTLEPEIEPITPEPSAATNILLEISLPVLFAVKYFI